MEVTILGSFFGMSEAVGIGKRKRGRPKTLKASSKAEVRRHRSEDVPEVASIYLHLDICLS
jgi:hypothetical protein